MITDEQIEGWCLGYEQEKLQELARKQQRRSKSDFLEIGSWKGKSGITIALTLEGDRRLWMIDHFRGNPVEHYPKRKVPEGKYSREGKPWAYPELLENIISFGVQDKVIIFPLSSKQASKAIDEQFCFIFIDGDHDWEGVSSDFYFWFPHLETNGIIIFHDGNHPPIRKFCDELKERSDLKLREDKSMPVFERIG